MTRRTDRMAWRRMRVQTHLQRCLGCEGSELNTFGEVAPPYDALLDAKPAAAGIPVAVWDGIPGLDPTPAGRC